jgi:hypothetical protein
LLAAGLLVVLGVRAATQLPLDAFPDTTPVQVQINTVASALLPEEVERLIAFPAEHALGGLKGLQEVRSVSKFGLCSACRGGPRTKRRSSIAWRTDSSSPCCAWACGSRGRRSSWSRPSRSAPRSST